MKNRLLIPIYMVGLLLSLSCSKIETLTVDEQDDFYVSQEMAKDFVFRMNVSRYEYSLIDYEPRDLAEISSVQDEQGRDVYHVLNYKVAGFMILAADSRISPILAYSELNHFDSQAKDYPAGLVDWLTQQKERVQEVRAKQSQQSALIKAEWEPIAPNLPLYTPSEIQVNNRPFDCAGISRQFGPLLWGSWTNTCASDSTKGENCKWYIDHSSLRGVSVWDFELYNRWRAEDDYPTDRYGHVSFIDLDTTNDPIWNLQPIPTVPVGEQNNSLAQLIIQLQRYRLINMEPNNLKPWRQFNSTKPHQHWYCDGYQVLQRWHGDCATGFSSYSNFLHMNWGWTGAFDGWFSTAVLSKP